jgi:hypothetical protein
MNRILFSIALLAAFGAIGSGQAANAKVRPAIPPGKENFFIGTPAGWAPPKTPWGDPDLQGIYPENFVGSVPFQRCANAGRGRGGGAPCDPNKEFLTEEEYKAAVNRYEKAPNQFQQAANEGQAGREFLRGVTDPEPPQRQTSFIFDPPNGKVPALTPEGKRIGDAMKSSWAVAGEQLTFDSYLDFDVKDRCVTHGMPASMFPFHYNNGLQIFQTPGQVTILIEMIHDVRIIPLDGPLSAKNAVPEQVQDWLGFSHGHWEGNTLVVETTNVKPGSMMINSAMPGTPQNHIPTSEKMKLTERFTRINDDYLIYEMKVEDPDVLTKPYTARIPWKRDQSYKLLEYACHEDNRMIRDWINVSQAEQAAAAKAKGK